MVKRLYKWDTLFKVKIKDWVQNTILKMNKNQEESYENWKTYWYETYKELVDEIKSSGEKGCPMCAAYGLWQLGYIVDSRQNVKKWNLQEIRNELGKNVVYAVLAIEILDEHQDIDIEELWRYVQNRYRQEKFPLNKEGKKKQSAKTKNEEGFEEPAEKRQGQVEIALALSKENLIIPLSLRK